MNVGVLEGREHGPSIEFEGLLDHIPEQIPDGSLEIDVSLTTGRTVGTVERVLTVFALRHDTVIPSCARRVNSA